MASDGDHGTSVWMVASQTDVEAERGILVISLTNISLGFVVFMIEPLLWSFCSSVWPV
jgi:hypothetical protein